MVETRPVTLSHIFMDTGLFLDCGSGEPLEG